MSEQTVTTMKTLISFVISFTYKSFCAQLTFESVLQATVKRRSYNTLAMSSEPTSVPTFFRGGWMEDDAEADKRNDGIMTKIGLRKG